MSESWVHCKHHRTLQLPTIFQFLRITVLLCKTATRHKLQVTSTMNNQQMHIKRFKSYITQDNSYMLRRQGAIFREFKVQRPTNTNTLILVLQ